MSDFKINRRGLLSMGAGTTLASLAGIPIVAHAQATVSTTTLRSLASVDISNMDDQTRLVISHAIINDGQKNFALISKNNSRFYIVENGIVVANYVVGLGEDNRGDVVDINLDNKVTPAGKFGVGLAILTNNANKVGVIFKCNPKQTKCVAVHSTYVGEFAERTRKLETPTITDNYFSNGCPNLAPPNQDAYLRFLARHEGKGEHKYPYLYVLPHDVSQTRELFDIPANFMASGVINQPISAPK